MAAPPKDSNPVSQQKFFTHFAELPCELRHTIWESNLPNYGATKDLTRTLVQYLLVDMHYEDSPRNLNPSCIERRRGPGATSTIFSLRIEGPCPYGTFAACAESRTVALKHLMKLLKEDERMKRWMKRLFPRVKMWINEKMGSLVFASRAYGAWKQWNLEELVFWDYETYEEEEQKKNEERRLWEARLALGDYSEIEATVKSDERGIRNQELVIGAKRELQTYHSFIADVPKHLPVAYAGSEAGTIYDEDLEQEPDFDFNIAGQEGPILWDDDCNPDDPLSNANQSESATTAENFITKPITTSPLNDSSLPLSTQTRISKRKRADEEDQDCTVVNRYDLKTSRHKRKQAYTVKEEGTVLVLRDCRHSPGSSLQGR